MSESLTCANHNVRPYPCGNCPACVTNERDQLRAELDAAGRKITRMLLRAEIDAAALEAAQERRAPVYQTARELIDAARRNESGSEGAEGSGVLIAWEALHESITALIDQRNAAWRDGAEYALEQMEAALCTAPDCNNGDAPMCPACARADFLRATLAPARTEPCVHTWLSANRDGSGPDWCGDCGIEREQPKPLADAAVIGPDGTGSGTSAGAFFDADRGTK